MLSKSAAQLDRDIREGMREGGREGGTYPEGLQRLGSGLVNVEELDDLVGAAGGEGGREGGREGRKGGLTRKVCKGSGVDSLTSRSLMVLSALPVAKEVSFRQARSRMGASCTLFHFCWV